VQSCGKNRRVIPKQGVAGSQKAREIGKNAMRYRSRSAIDDQQSRLIPSGGGRLRNQVFWKRVIEELGGQ